VNTTNTRSLCTAFGITAAHFDEAARMLADPIKGRAFANRLYITWAYEHEPRAILEAASLAARTVAGDNKNGAVTKMLKPLAVEEAMALPAKALVTLLLAHALRDVFASSDRESLERTSFALRHVELYLEPKWFTSFGRRLASVVGARAAAGYVKARRSTARRERPAVTPVTGYGNALAAAK